ncbi:MAG TPA: hypothetical protein VF026_31500 [Ktedonobacteraceae bacterium]
MGVLLAFRVTRRRHPSQQCEAQGSKMPPAGGCLPQALPLYW